MRARVYALSSEVAHVTRERDMLRIQQGQPPGPTLPAGRYAGSILAFAGSTQFLLFLDVLCCILLQQSMGMRQA